MFFNINEGLVLVKLANTVLILINTGPSNVNFFKSTIEMPAATPGVSKDSLSSSPFDLKQQEKTWADIWCLTLLGPVLIEINTVSANFNNTRPLLILNN